MGSAATPAPTSSASSSASRAAIAVRTCTSVHDPTGELMDWPTNVSWGGRGLRDLYIGSIRKDYVLHARSPVPGMPLVHQR